MICLRDHIPTDGLTDAGPILRQLLADNPGGTFYLGEGERYVCGSRGWRYEVIRLGSGQSLVGPGTLAYDSTRDPSTDIVVRLISGHADAAGIELRDLTIEHRSGWYSKEQSAAVHFYAGQSEIVVEGVTVSIAEGGDGFYFGTGTHHVRVEDCHVQDHARSAYVLGGYGAGRSHFMIRNNTQAWAPGYGRPGGRLIDLETQGGDPITHVRLVGNSGAGAIETHLASGEIRGNRSGQHVHVRTRGCTIDGNIVRSEAGNGAVRFLRYQEADFSDNSIESAGAGIVIEGLANGGALWRDVHPGSVLVGVGNAVLLRNPTSPTVNRIRQDPAESLTAPAAWLAAP
jgi:hypothetical protein